VRTRNSLAVVTAGCLGIAVACPAVAVGAAGQRPAYRLFDVGGAIPGAVDTDVTGLTATASTPGLVVGTYRNQARQLRGFVARTGKDFRILSVRSVNVSGASDVIVTSVNRGGTVSGYYLSATDNVMRGFLQDPQGKLTPFDHPNAVKHSATEPEYWSDYGGTYPEQFADKGTVVGYYTILRDNGTWWTRGFTWTRTGGWTSLDFAEVVHAPADVPPPGYGNQLFGMNDRGTLVGNGSFSTGATSGTQRGIAVNGRHVITYAFPGPPTLPSGFCGWTSVQAINDVGIMVGNAGNGCEAWARAWMIKAGRWSVLQYQDSRGRQAPQTVVVDVTGTGLITGTWSSWTGVNSHDWAAPDDSRAYGTWHGFIATT